MRTTMKPRNAILLATAIVLGAAAAGPLQAQSPRDQRPLSVYIDIAYINLGTPPRWMALAPELEWRLARPLSINPEVALWFPDTFRGNVQIVPGATANFHLDRFFLGGGAVWRVPAWDPDANGRLVPKLQIGYLMGGAKIALTLHLPGGIYDAALGLSIGTRIGRPGR
jgi:hypothetical protein